MYAQRHIITFVLILISLMSAYSQQKSRLYKRVMVVDGQHKTSCNDDAHFLSFTNNGFYESDKNGNAIGSIFIEYVKDDNGYHCYAGVTPHGYSMFYFTKDFSRMNMKCGNKTMVYQKETGTTTTALMRRHDSRNNKNNNAPISPIYTSPTTTDYGSGNRKRVCPGCNGTGKGSDEITYAPDYTGRQLDVYCSVCGRVMSPHSHRTPMCMVCYGRGTVE